jgi:hypothetical protein
MHAMPASRGSLLDALGRFIEAAISHSSGTKVSSRQRKRDSKTKNFAAS